MPVSIEMNDATDTQVECPHVRREARRRRTFAIISHPDAGKTTLTENLLLRGGRVDIAGVVRGRRNQRATASDWMEIEKQRGISVSSTVLPFEYQGYQINLLDTPGHHDFSEDTYRTLLAADCAVMVIDVAKGVEPQTQKLFDVCKRRRIPVITFVNKIDRVGREPLSLFSEIEEELGITAAAMQWPIGFGHDYRGLYDFQKGVASVTVSGPDDDAAEQSVPLDDLERAGVPGAQAASIREEIDLVALAGGEFSEEEFRQGRLTPVYFGSALKGYGVERFLAAFLELCPAPGGRLAGGQVVAPARQAFSGFIFKIQANLDPRHRDRVAFLRVCSGRFQRDMEVTHVRTGGKVRLGRAHLVFGQQRETVEEAYPGDIVGLVNPGMFRLGDTLSEGPPIAYPRLPTFPPEHFATIRCPATDRRKQFERGLHQLLEEGAIQVFVDVHSAQRDVILGAVGELQFDVVQHRLRSEYNTETRMDRLPYSLVRWVVPADEEGPSNRSIRPPYGSRLVKDRDGDLAVLFENYRDAQLCDERNPHVRLLTTNRADADNRMT